MIAIEIPGNDRDPIPLGVRIGSLVYASQILGIDLETGGPGAGVEQQLELAFQNLKTAVERAGAALDSVAHVTIFLTRLADRQFINKPWVAMFPNAEDRPTYIFMESDLPGELLVQLQVWAALDGKRQLLSIAGVAHTNPIPLAVKIGAMLFSSRLLGAEPGSGKTGEGAKRQAELVFRHMRTLLQMGGGTAANVTQVTVFLKQPEYAQTVAGPWRETFAGVVPGPLRHDVTVDLPGDLQVMASFIAAL